MTDSDIEFIRKHIDSRHFSTDAIIRCLKSMTHVDSNSFFENPALCFNSTLSKQMIPSLTIEEFIRIIPFLYYNGSRDGKTKGFGNVWHIFVSSIPDKGFNQYNPYLDSDIRKPEEVYPALSFAYYEVGIALDDIFNYWIEQQLGYHGDLFFVWINYLRLCKKHGYTDHLPECLIYEYNRLLEKEKKQPITYCIVERSPGSYFDRSNNILSFSCRIPYDHNQTPIMRWIGLHVKNCEILDCEKKQSHVNTLSILARPNTEVFMLEESTNEWKLLFAAPEAEHFQQYVKIATGFNLPEDEKTELLHEILSEVKKRNSIEPFDTIVDKLKKGGLIVGSTKVFGKYCFSQAASDENILHCIQGSMSIDNLFETGLFVNNLGSCYKNRHTFAEALYQKRKTRKAQLWKQGHNYI